MVISHKRLLKLMIDRDMKKKDLKQTTGLSYATISKLEKGRMLRQMCWIRFAVNWDVS